MLAMVGFYNMELVSVTGYKTAPTIIGAIFRGQAVSVDLMQVNTDLHKLAQILRDDAGENDWGFFPAAVTQKLVSTRPASS